MGGGSGGSAARFLSTRATRRGVDDSVPAEWHFVESECPGAFTAWLRDVAAPVDAFLLGVQGRPARGVATDRRCYTPRHVDCQCRTHVDCQCRTLVDGEWRRRTPFRGRAP